ncbi:UNVERIFIED_CONTAM: hypothetical protein Slati_2477500 [Sesamum latifolium]|uniref:Secreted protein n=1 Tax=Sesamum latifolium TaxID=2727402 RepID=A0AAW2WDS8_9LAMI
MSPDWLGLLALGALSFFRSRGSPAVVGSMPREGHFDPPTPGRTGWCPCGSPSVHFVRRIDNRPNLGFLMWVMRSLVVGLGPVPLHTYLGRAGGSLWASFSEGLGCYRKWAGLEFFGLYTSLSPPTLRRSP